MKKLNRIEQNFIFQNFIKDKPLLRLISQEGKIIKVPNTQYRIDNNFIELSADLNFKGEAYNLLFPHKGRLVLSSIVMQEKAISSFFQFPDNLFLYDNNNPTTTSAKLLLQINKKTSDSKLELVNSELNVRVLKDFPLFNFEQDLINPQNNNALLTNVRLMLNYQNKNLANDFCTSRIYFFLQELMGGRISEFETSVASSFFALLFLSENCAVFFLPENIFKLLKLSVTNSLSVKIKKRFMKINLGKVAGLMKLNQSNVLASNMLLISVATEKLAIEDKRFLNEEMYKTRYGQK